MTAAPTLITDRLRLRGHVRSDFDSSHALWSDPIVVKHITGKPSTRSESWARLLRGIGHWHAVGYGYWLVEDKDSGQFLGEVGLADFKRDMTPSFEGRPEAGWVMAPHAHGRGFGREAVRAVLDWADQTLDAPQTVCMIDLDNNASRRLALDVGFIPAGTAAFGEETVSIFERARKK